jgi:hypothetical protein
MKNIETRLQKLEKSTPVINSLSELSDEELKIEANQIKAQLQTVLESGDCSDEEFIEISRVLEKN